MEEEAKKSFATLHVSMQATAAAAVHSVKRKINNNWTQRCDKVKNESERDQNLRPTELYTSTIYCFNVSHLNSANAIALRPRNYHRYKWFIWKIRNIYTNRETYVRRSANTIKTQLCYIRWLLWESISLRMYRHLGEMIVCYCAWISVRIEYKFCFYFKWAWVMACV